MILSGRFRDSSGRDHGHGLKITIHYIKDATLPVILILFSLAICPRMVSMSASLILAKYH